MCPWPGASPFTPWLQVTSSPALPPALLSKPSSRRLGLGSHRQGFPITGGVLEQGGAARPWKDLGSEGRSTAIGPSPDPSLGWGLPHLSHALWEGPAINRRSDWSWGPARPPHRNPVTGGNTRAPAVCTLPCGLAPLLFFWSSPVATAPGAPLGEPHLAPSSWGLPSLRGLEGLWELEGEARRGDPGQSPQSSPGLLPPSVSAGASCGRLTSVPPPVRGQQWSRREWEQEYL